MATQRSRTNEPSPALLKMHSQPHFSRAAHCTRHVDRRHTHGTINNSGGSEQYTHDKQLKDSAKHVAHDKSITTERRQSRVSEPRRPSWCLEHSAGFPVAFGNKLTGNKFKKVGKLIIQTRRRPMGYGYPSVPNFHLEEFDGEYDFDADDEPSAEDEERKRQTKRLEESYCKMCKMAGTVPCGKYKRQIDSATADLSNCLLGEKDIKAICVSLTNNVDITDLDLSGNDLSGKGSRYISEALRENLNIQELTIAECNIDLEGLKCIADVLLEMKPMKYLDMSGNKFGVNHAIVLADVIKKNDYIEDLVLSNNGFDEESGVILGKAMQHNVGLKRLDLSWNHLRRHGATAVCTALRFNQSIEDLDLSWNGLCEEGCKALGYALPFNHTLRHLDISCNRINIFALRDFLKGLEKNDTLGVLRIDQNPITTDGAIIIMKTLQKSETSQISDVHMVDIPINGDFLESLDELHTVRNVRVFHRDPNRKKISPIIRKRTLKDFDPAMILFEYMKQENLRLIDLFRTFDTDSSQSVSKDELRQGFNTINMPLTDDALDSLFSKLDMNDNDEIEYEEIRRIHRKIITKMRVDEKSVENFTSAMHTLSVLVKKSLAEKRAQMKESAKNRPLLSLKDIMDMSRRSPSRSRSKSPRPSNPFVNLFGLLEPSRVSEYKVGYRKAMRKMRGKTKREDVEAITQLKSLVKQALHNRREEKLRMFKRPRKQRQASLTAVFENTKGESLIHVIATHPDPWV